MTDTTREAVARAIYDEIEGPVNNQDFTRQTRQWELAQRLAAAAIAAYEAVTAGDGWQDIATAPKDETWCLLYSPDAETLVVAFYAPDQDDGQDGWYESEAASNPSLESDTFTQWRPLPAPPAAQEPS